MCILFRVLGEMVILKEMEFKDIINRAPVMLEGSIQVSSKVLELINGITEEANTTDSLVKV